MFVSPTMVMVVVGVWVMMVSMAAWRCVVSVLYVEGGKCVCLAWFFRWELNGNGFCCGYDDVLECVSVMLCLMYVDVPPPCVFGGLGWL